MFIFVRLRTINGLKSRRQITESGGPLGPGFFIHPQPVFHLVISDDKKSLLRKRKSGWKRGSGINPADQLADEPAIPVCHPPVVPNFVQMVLRPAKQVYEDRPGTGRGAAEVFIDNTGVDVFQGVPAEVFPIRPSTDRGHIRYHGYSDPYQA